MQNGNKYRKYYRLVTMRRKLHKNWKKKWKLFSLKHQTFLDFNSTLYWAPLYTNTNCCYNNFEKYFCLDDADCFFFFAFFFFCNFNFTKDEAVVAAAAVKNTIIMAGKKVPSHILIIIIFSWQTEKWKKNEMKRKKNNRNEFLTDASPDCVYYL